MFGVLKFRGCKKGHQERYERRLHYCGTCKTMGRMYGQQTRLLLNHDAVFLAELLTELSGAARPSTWARPFQSRNCFSLPAKSTDIPVPLQIAATATVVLTKFKIRDQIVDGESPLKWRLAEAFYGSSFRKATSELAGLGLSEEDLWQWFDEQIRRESACKNNDKGDSQQLKTLLYLAEPTGAATATIYKHSALRIGLNGPAVHFMERFGESFGKLVYILDALGDYARDITSGAFNAIACAFEINQPLSSIPREVDERVRHELTVLTDDLQSTIKKLPIDLNAKKRFSRRLKENLTAITSGAGSPEEQQAEEQPTLEIGDEERQSEQRRRNSLRRIDAGASVPCRCCPLDPDDCLCGCDLCECASCDCGQCGYDCSICSGAGCCDCGLADCCGSGSTDCCTDHCLSGCDCPGLDCAGCDCGGCDWGGCDCGGCSCN